MPNLVLRFPHLSFCHKVFDYKSLMLIGSGADFPIADTCNKAIRETSSVQSSLQNRTSTGICIPEKSLLSLGVCFHKELIT